MKKINSWMAVLVFGLVAMMQTGCMRPFDKPTFADVEANETAFVVDLEQTGNQDVFQSIELLQKKMVAAKRIQIPHRWVKTGRFSPALGHYVDMVKVIKVDRTPITQTLQLAAESKDSLEVGVGFTLTASILPGDAATYLFRYKEKDLRVVVGSQILNSIQVIFGEECAKTDLLKLSEQKAAMLKELNSIIAFYKEWGITIEADMGFVGGFVYDDIIQKQFDNVFASEKAKETALAEEEAQIVNNRKDKAVRQNDADIKQIDADAEAYSIAVVAEAINSAGPMYIKSEYIKKWDGILSKVSSGGGMSMILDSKDL